MYFVDAQQYPTYALNVANIHLIFGTNLPTPKSPLITKILDTLAASKTIVSKEVDPTNTTSSTQAQPTVEPPFPEKIIQHKLAQIEEQTFDIIN